MKYIQKVRDRHDPQRFHFYYRRNGTRVALGGDPEVCEKALLAYATAMQRPAVVEPRAAAGTVGRLVIDYLASPNFRERPDSVQRPFRRKLERFAADHGGKPVARCDLQHLRALMLEMRHTPAAANEWRKAMVGLFTYAVETGQLASNPAAGLKKYAARKNESGEGGFRTWSADERARYCAVHPVGSPARLAYELIWSTGVRGSDAILLGREHLRMIDGCLHWDFTEAKNRNRKPNRIVKPADPALIEVIKATPGAWDRIPVGPFLRNSQGATLTRRGWHRTFRAWCAEAGLPEHCTAHGIRKAFVCDVLQAGATEDEAMAASGHRDRTTFQVYARQVRRQELAVKAQAKRRTSAV